MNNFKEMKVVLNKLNYILTSNQKKGVYITMVFIIIGAIFELFGVSIIVPFINAMLTPDELWENEYLATILKWFHIQTDVGMLLFFGCLIIFFYVIKNLVIAVATYAQAKFSTVFLCELSVRMLDTYMLRPYNYFRKLNSSEVMRATTGDASNVYIIVSNLLDLATQMMMTSFIALYLIYTDAGMALGVLLLAGGSLLIIVVVLKKRMKRLGVAQREANKESTQMAYETIEGIKEITVMDRRANFVDRFRKATDKKQNATLWYTFISACPERVIETICVSGFIGVVCVKILMGNDIVTFIPKLAAFALAAFKIMPSVSKISSRVNSIVFYKPALDSIYAHLRELEKESKKNEQFEGKFIHVNFKNELKVKNIFWRYDDGTKNILEDVSLTINKGESIALIGPSGAGKTTLADIILGLFIPQQGSIELDGTDIRNIRKQWASIVGYVPQNVFLLDDTIKSNIVFGLSQDKIDEKEIWEALEQAQLKEFVEDLPDKLETIVGEHGVKFSGGQRQRLAIARALYHNADILVLDEATSALDNETEDALMEAINGLKGEKTLIIIAHRLSTISNCDKVYEVRDGKASLKKSSEICQEIID